MRRSLSTDVLVIGGGGAAARAALEARLLGADVTLAVKGDFGAVGTRGAGATCSAVSPFGIFATPGWTGPITGGEKPMKNMIGVDPDKAFSNIIQVGLGMADPRLARIIVDEAVETRKRLISLGCSFGEYGMRSHGVPIMAGLVWHIRQSGVNVLERTMIVDLIVENGECMGAVGVNELTGDTIVIAAGSTIVATGGDAHLFLENLNPPCNTGDGYAMGYRAGAELMNLEFKQVFLATVFPTRNMLIRTLPPHVRLTNAHGEEFLKNYLPEGASVEECLAQRNARNPFSTRDSLSRYVDIAIMGEVKAGRGTAHNGIYLDRTDPRNPVEEVQRTEYWLYRGIDFSKSPVEVGICHHSSLGGIRIDENAETTVPHLYAAGEAAAGPHGADRVGGCMLLTSQVFGARAGKHGAKVAMSRKRPEISERMVRKNEERIDAVRRRRGTTDPAAAKRMLQESAYYNMLVVRSERSLNKVLDDANYMEEKVLPAVKAETPKQLVEALELENLLALAKLEASVCLKRTESRGPHYREDYPQQNDRDWAKVITVRMAGDSLELGTVTVDPCWANRGDEKIGGYWA